MSEGRPASHVWRKSTASSFEHCVEVRFMDESAHVRNSRDPEGPHLHFTLPEWESFLAGARDGEFDLPADA